MYKLFLAQFGWLFLALGGLVVRLNNAAPDGGLYLNSSSLLDVSQSRSFWNPSRLPFLGLSLANAASSVFWTPQSRLPVIRSRLVFMRALPG
ncbi:hypothetical protein Zmor_023248 [Zophobas morio]|uniref:Uncharacterized protein n=1 Tax=Zophobas morio TaxID=2755281 RepID=A0AA38M6U7_9CUCU|nr:hypothetical protein Zmor_023248 [Zophobas morio]